MSRDPAMLTPDQRAYLRGKKDYSRQVENNTRYDIRKRVRNTLLDFGLLLEEMDARDREQIFKDVRPPSLRDDEEFQSETIREDELGGLVRTLAFLYLGADETGVPFEKALEQAIFAARSTDQGDPFVAQSVEVTIDEEIETDVDRLFRKIERGKHLDEVEYFRLTRLVVTDLERFVEGTNSVDVDVIPLLERGDSLTRGESLIVVGRVFEDATQFREYNLFELLHDDVITHLGLSNAKHLY